MRCALAWIRERERDTHTHTYEQRFRRLWRLCQRPMKHIDSVGGEEQDAHIQGQSD